MYSTSLLWRKIWIQLVPGVPSPRRLWKACNPQLQGIAQGLLPGTPDQPMAVNSIPRGQCLQWKQNIGNYWLSREFSAKVVLLVVDKQLQRVSQTHPFLFFFSYSKVYSVQFSSVTWSYSTLCDSMDRSTPGLPVHHQLPEFTQTQVLWAGDAIQPSHSPPALHLSQPSGSFQTSQLFTSGGQSIGASASTSVLPMNTQDWSPLGWTSWISLQSKGFSRVFCNTTVQKHQFFSAQLSL